MEALLNHLKSIDRRIIFLILFVLIVFSFLFPQKLKVPIEPSVKKAYQTLKALKPGDLVLISFDYGPATMPEIHPAAVAMMRQLFHEHVKIAMMTLWNEGLPMIQDAIREVCVPLKEKPNVDYVNFGFKYGGLTGASVITELGKNMKNVFPVTNDGVSYNKVPLLKGIRNLKKFKLLISLSAGYPGTVEYIQYEEGVYHVPIVAAVSKVMAPSIFPFLQSGQLKGLCSGLLGAAEYEELVHHPGFGLTGLFALSVSQMVILFFILLGNVIYFGEKFYEKRNLEK
jgi:hypothetical protein